MNCIVFSPLYNCRSEVEHELYRFIPLYNCRSEVELELYRFSPLYNCRSEVEHELYRFSPLYNCRSEVELELYRIQPTLQLQEWSEHELYRIQPHLQLQEWSGAWIVSVSAPSTTAGVKWTMNYSIADSFAEGAVQEVIRNDSLNSLKCISARKTFKLWRYWNKAYP